MLIKSLYEKITKSDSISRQIIIAISIIAVGILASTILSKFKKPPVKIKEQLPAPLVKVTTLKSQDVQMIVHGNGTVEAKLEVEIVPQVSGKVTFVHLQFRPGGFVRAGETIFQIDPRDYALAVQQAEAGVAEAQVRLELEEAEGEVALQEWEQLNPGTEPISGLVLRKPQIAQARAKLNSAKATLAVARLNLERTKVVLPVNVRIVEKTIDLGQYITSGRTIGRAYGMDAVEINVPLEDHELAWFDVPGGFNGDNSKKGSKVIIKTKFAGSEHRWQGHVVRTTGEVDRKSRFVNIVVEVPEPFDAAGAKPQLLPGMFVEVLIMGRQLEDVFAVPRYALHNGDQAWVVSNQTLHIKKLEIIRLDENFAYVSDGIEDGIEIILSSLDTVVDGMKIRTKTEKSDE